jgi:hypothetical protein
MKISICSNLYDYSGDYLLDYNFESSELSFFSRRVSRTATLDGKATIVDNGYTASDATFTIVLTDITARQKLSLLTMMQLHSLITVSVNSNLFLGVVESVQDRESLKIKFLVKNEIHY